MGFGVPSVVEDNGMGRHLDQLDGFPEHPVAALTVDDGERKSLGDPS